MTSVIRASPPTKFKVINNMSIKGLFTVVLGFLAGIAEVHAAGGVVAAGASGRVDNAHVSVSPQLIGPDGYLTFRKDLRNFRRNRGIFEYCLNYEPQGLVSPAKCHEFGGAQAYVSRNMAGMNVKYVGMGINARQTEIYLFYTIQNDDQK